MKKLIIATFLFLVISIFSFGQKFYSAKGIDIEKLTKSTKTVGDVYRYFVPSGLYHDYLVTGIKDDKMATITFKLFTNEPIMYIGDHPDRIKKYTSMFSLTKYFSSWHFEFDIERHIKKKDLTDVYVINTLGKPDERLKTADGNNAIENYTYNSLNLLLTFTNSIVTSYSILR